MLEEILLVSAFDEVNKIVSMVIVQITTNFRRNNKS